MKDAKETKKVIFIQAVVGSVFIVSEIIRITFHPSRPSPIYFIAGMSVVSLYVLGYVLYSRKSDMAELRKRIIPSIAFAFIFGLFAIALGYKISGAITLGVPICPLLLFKAPNWKSHVAAILIPPAVFIIGMKIDHTTLFTGDRPTEGLLLKTIISTVCVMLALSFYLLYLPKLINLKPIDFKAIVIRSVKFSLFITVLFGLYLVLLYFGLQDKSDFPISLAISLLLLPLVFVAIGYQFDLLLIERKKRPQKVNELEEILREYNISKDRQSDETPDNS